MPTYDYRCDPCDATFEVKRSIADRSPEQCPTCGAEARRLMSAPAVVFKGSGFHNTDYKPRPKEDTGSGDAKPAAPCASASDKPACSSCPAAKPAGDASA
jgi:putative FmdB family regulatory protein